MVRIHNILDYDVAPSYTLTIRAQVCDSNYLLLILYEQACLNTLQDNGTPQLLTDITLTVNLVDVLDPPPAFAFRAYSVEVAEGSYTNVCGKLIK